LAEPEGRQVGGKTVAAARITPRPPPARTIGTVVWLHRAIVALNFPRPDRLAPNSGMDMAGSFRSMTRECRA